MEVFIDYLAELNYLAVLLASFAAFAVGALWYSDKLYGKQWKKEVGLTDKKIKEAKMADVMSISLLTIIVSAMAIGILADVLVLTTVYQGALFGVMLAVGLLGTNKLMQVQYEQRSWKYFFITVSADILSFAVMGAILAVWQ